MIGPLDPGPPIADQEARLIYLREYAGTPPLFLPPRWDEAPSSVKSICRAKADQRRKAEDA